MTQSAMALSLAGISFLLTVIWGPPLIRILRHFKVGKQIRVRRPRTTFYKNGHTHNGRRDDRDPGCVCNAASECRLTDWGALPRTIDHLADGCDGSIRCTGSCR